MSENNKVTQAAVVKPRFRPTRSATLLAVCVGIGLPAWGPAAWGADGFVAPPAPYHWLDRLAAADRLPLEGWIDFLPPAFNQELRWVADGGGAVAPAQSPRWSDWYGKVIVVQSWSNANHTAVERLAEMAEVAGEFSEIDVQFIALHTPEGAAAAPKFIREFGDWPHLTAIDPEGDFCDLLGVYRTPVNVIIGRNGAVRYAGLSPDGARDAIDFLLDEDVTSAPCRGSRPLDDEAAASGRTPGSGNFPPHNPNPRARNLQGQRGPAFHVESWANHPPSVIDGRVNVIKFWRTTCPHCITAIPKTEELTREYAGRVNFIAISHEDFSTVRDGLARRQQALESLRHSIAIDTSSRMRQQVGSQGVPNAMIVDSNWIVRWQGNPAQITQRMLDQILEADGSGAGGSIVARWKAEREGEIVPAPPAASTLRPVDADGSSRTTAAEPRPQQPAVERRVQRRSIEYGPADFPPVSGDSGAAVDLRGKPGPEFYVDQWVSARPLHIGGKVTFVEFFRTSCPACRRALPKINDLNTQFAGVVDFIVISTENEATFNSGLQQHQLSMRSFNHFVALDPTRRMVDALRPRGVPHAIILDSDWIVRWQGNPHSLTPEILEQIVVADAWKRRQGG